MQITCKCLNVVIEVKGQKYEIIDKALRSILGNDSFFKEEIATVDLSSVTKKLPTLVDVHNSGPWVIHRCLNCGLHTYAYNQDAGTNTIIVSGSLLSDAKEIAELKNSEMYSPAFKIVIYHTDANTGSTPESGDHKLYSQLAAWLEEQTARTEERIQAYTEQQYADLEVLKARAHRDHLAISRIVSSITKSPEVRIATSTTVPDEEKETAGANSVPALKHEGVSSHKKLSANGTSIDSEGLFALDDIEGYVNEGTKVEDNGSDVSDGEEGQQLSRRYGSDGQFAKSLPVPVPQFMQDKHQNDSSSGSPHMPSDIAASIKALAKSVHGDTIFGELPRPRFSTHL